jgi:hypothetical protein
MPGIAAACGLVVLAVVTLSWVNQVQARSYEIGSRDALEASAFDPFMLTADSFMLRSMMTESAEPEVASAAMPMPAPAPSAAPGPSAGATYIPPIRVPYRPPLRSPMRPPL